MVGFADPRHFIPTIFYPGRIAIIIDSGIALEQQVNMTPQPCETVGGMNQCNPIPAVDC